MGLITLDYFAGLIGRDTDAASTDEETIWQNHIDGATGIINSYVTKTNAGYKRDLSNVDYSEEQYSGNGTSILIIKQYPVQSVSEIKVGGSVIDDYDFLNKGIIIREGGLFTAGFKNIKVSYNAGYNTVPADLQVICGRIAMRTFLDQKGEGDGRLNIESEKVDNVTDMKYIKEILSDRELSTLDWYKDKRKGRIST